MKIGVIGSGQVGRTLATALLKEGHEIKLGTRDITNPAVIAWMAAPENQGATVGNFQETASFGESIVLAVKGSKATAALDLSGLQNFTGKLVIDVTNPIADTPPVNGVISFFTDPNESLMEIIQNTIPEARVVKAFNSVGSHLMYQPTFDDGRPTMFICGNDDDAKNMVRDILTSFGWDTEDMGKVEAARAIEPLCILWCIPGFLRNDWNHAFHMKR
jgi:8-hydroxy-5-deazaflavin:NADPH oxidoreductase